MDGGGRRPAPQFRNPQPRRVFIWQPADLERYLPQPLPRCPPPLTTCQQRAPAPTWQRAIPAAPRPSPGRTTDGGVPPTSKSDNADALLHEEQRPTACQTVSAKLHRTPGFCLKPQGIGHVVKHLPTDVRCPSTLFHQLRRWTSATLQTVRNPPPRALNAERTTDIGNHSNSVIGAPNALLFGRRRTAAQQQDSKFHEADVHLYGYQRILSAFPNPMPDGRRPSTLQLHQTTPKYSPTLTHYRPPLFTTTPTTGRRAPTLTARGRRPPFHHYLA